MSPTIEPGRFVTDPEAKEVIYSAPYPRMGFSLILPDGDSVHTRFQKGTFRCVGEEAVRCMDNSLKLMSSALQGQISKVSRATADEIARKHIAAMGGAVQGPYTAQKVADVTAAIGSPADLAQRATLNVLTPEERAALEAGQAELGKVSVETVDNSNKSAASTGLMAAIAANKQNGAQ